MINTLVAYPYNNKFIHMTTKDQINTRTTLVINNGTMIFKTITAMPINIDNLFPECKKRQITAFIKNDIANITFTEEAPEEHDNTAQLDLFFDNMVFVMHSTQQTKIDCVTIGRPNKHAMIKLAECQLSIASLNVLVKPPYYSYFTDSIHNITLAVDLLSIPCCIEENADHATHLEICFANVKCSRLDITNYPQCNMPCENCVRVLNNNNHIAHITLHTINASTFGRKRPEYTIYVSDYSPRYTDDTHCKYKSLSELGIMVLAKK